MKTSQLFLSTVFLASITACTARNNQQTWITGDEHTADSTFNEQPYRYYNNSWYPVYNGLISPRLYEGASRQQLADPGYNPAPRVVTGGTANISYSRFPRSGAVRSGGFGHTAHGGHSSAGA